MNARPTSKCQYWVSLHKDLLCCQGPLLPSARQARNARAWMPSGNREKKNEKKWTESHWVIVQLKWSIVVQLLSCVWLFTTHGLQHARPLCPSLSLSLFKLMSIELVMPSNHVVLCCPFFSCLQSFPASGSFPISWLFTSGGQSIGALASASVLPMDSQD